ncbi:MAG: cupredoxin domain-containing protein, partial [Actinomycetota bacterium]
MRRVVAAALILFVVSAPLAGARAAETAVHAGDDYFDPGVVRVQVGATITWDNAGRSAHTVTADDGSYGGALFNGGMYSHTFDSPGTFTYHCTIHPTMRGEVDVYRLLLDAAGPAVSPGDAYMLSGHASLP